MNPLYGYGPATAAAQEIMADIRRARPLRTKLLHRRHLDFLALIYEVDPTALQRALRQYSDMTQPLAVS